MCYPLTYHTNLLHLAKKSFSFESISQTTQLELKYYCILAYSSTSLEEVEQKTEGCTGLIFLSMDTSITEAFENIIQ